MKIKLSQIINTIFILLFLEIFLGYWIHSTKYTISQISASVPVLFAIIFCFLFVIKFIRFNKSLKDNFLNTFKIVIPIICWLPYMVYTLWDNFIHFKYCNFCDWLICLFILLMSISCSFYKHYPFKFLFYWGIIAELGSFFQLFFPSLHGKYIASLFLKSERIIAWGNSFRGLAGITYQLDVVAIAVFYSLGFYIYLRKLFLKKYDKVFYYLPFYFFLLIGIFLAGKRIFMLLIILIPTFISYISIQNKRKMVIASITICLSIIISLIYLFNNLNNIVDIPFLGRLAKIAIMADSGKDYSSGRYDLWEMAIRAWGNNKTFGIGYGNYIPFTGSHTAPHNTYLQILCEQGYVGLFLFIIPLFICLMVTIYRIRLSSNKNNIAILFLKFSLFIQLSHILYSITGNTNVNHHCFFMYYIAISLLAYMSKEKILLLDSFSKK